MSARFYRADWICPVASPPIRDGVIGVEAGRIVSISSAPEAGAPLTSFPGCALIPGFVNAHSHLELTLLRGMLENMDFVTWIRTLTRTKYERLRREDLLVSARLGAAECLRAGVTAVGEAMDVGTSWTAMQEFDLQGIAFQELFGPAPIHASEALDGARRKIEAIRADETETRRVGISPHAPFTVAPNLFQAVSAYARTEGLRATIHIAESADEDLYVRHGEGPFAARNRERDFEIVVAGCSPIEHLRRLGVLGGDVVLIHAVRADSMDVEAIARSGAAVVHCPKSNAKLGHGIAPVSDMAARGVSLGLGTDSVASNNNVDMFEEMRHAVFLQRLRTGRMEALDAARALRMATLGGAECLGLQRHIGSLEPGKRADFVVVDLNDPAIQPVYDPVESMVYSASRSNVRATYLGGRKVEVDATALQAEAARIAERLRS